MHDDNEQAGGVPTSSSAPSTPNLRVITMVKAGAGQPSTSQLSSVQAPPQEMVTIPLTQLTTLQVDHDAYHSAIHELNQIAMYFREHYRQEIQNQEPQHQGQLSNCVIFYLRRERGRLSVRWRNFWGALERIGQGR